MNPLQKNHQVLPTSSSFRFIRWFLNKQSVTHLCCCFFMRSQKKSQGRGGKGKKNGQTREREQPQPLLRTKAATSWARARGSPSAFLSQGSNQEVFDPIQDEEMQLILSFCKTWWLNICLNLYLPLGHIFFSYKAHFMCAWGKVRVGECTYFNHFSTFSSLTVCGCATEPHESPSPCPTSLSWIFIHFL